MHANSLLALKLAGLFIVLYVVAGFAYFYHFLMIGRRDARNAVVFQQNPINPTEVIVIAGDSTGVGTGAEGPQFSVAGYFGADRPSARIINISVNGLTTRQIRERLQELGPEKADLILLQTGGNDILGATNLEQLAGDIEDLLTVAQTKSDKVILQMPGNVGVSPMFPFPASTFFARQTRLVREVFIEAAAQHNVPFVDLYREPKDDPFYGHLEYYGNDRLHLSGKGYRYWYERILEKL